MNPTFNLKKAIPYIAAILIFITVTLGYFSPLLGGKKQLQQGDVQHFQGMSKEIQDFRAKTGGQEPLWTNSMFGGMPAYQISVTYHGNLLKYVNSILTLGLPHPSGYVFLYMLGFFILLLALRVNPWVAIVGAIAFGFSSYFFIILEAGHNSKAHAISFMAPVVAGFILSFRGKYLVGGALTALFLGLELYANHLQITYYLAIFLVIYSVAEFIQAIRLKTLPGFFRSAGVLAAAGILAVLPNITNIWATYEYGKYTTRGKSELTITETGKSNAYDKTDGLDRSYATGWSYGIGESFSLLIPNFKGGSSEAIGTHHADALKEVPSEMKEYVGQMDSYYGDQPFTSGPVYAGAIVLFLFVLGLFVVKGPLKWAILAATVLSLLLAWGRNYMGFTDFFFDHIPGYNKFRAVSMILVIAEFTLPLLAILALDQVLKSKDFFNEQLKVPFTQIVLSSKKAFFIAFGFTGGLCLLFLVAPGLNDFYKSAAAFSDGSPSGEREHIYAQVVKSAGPAVSNQLVDGLESARKAIFKADVIRSLVFICLAGVLLFFYFRSSIQGNLVIAAIGVFILLDMWLVDKRYLNDTSFVPKQQVQVPYQPSEADLQILEDKDPDFRVLNVAANTFNDAGTSYFHKSIGGYHGAKLKRYQELIDFQISKNNQSVLNMLNTKYVITTAGQNQPLVAQRNPNALGNAWFVNEFKLVANADSEIVALGHFDPRKTAIVDKRYAPELSGLQPAKDSAAFIKLTSYEPNDLVYESSNRGEGLAVFSEIYYEKGWNAYVNGKLTPHIRANYVLRALRLPAGTNKIEFKFEPALYATGEKIAYAGSVLLLLFCAGSAFLAWKKCKEEKSAS